MKQAAEDLEVLAGGIAARVDCLLIRQALVGVSWAD